MVFGALIGFMIAAGPGDTAPSQERKASVERSVETEDTSEEPETETDNENKPDD
jgi:hypothetical protein